MKVTIGYRVVTIMASLAWGRLAFAGEIHDAAEVQQRNTPSEKMPTEEQEPHIQQGRAWVQPTRLVTYKKVDGRELKLHIFEPEGHRPTDRCACFMVIHGGGWVKGQPRGFYPFAAYFAKRGMVGISLEYRLVGEEAASAADCVKDGRSAVRYLRQHSTELGVDPQKIIVAGGSAGGHIAAGTALFEGIDEAGEDLTVSCIPNALVLYYSVLDTSNAYCQKKCGEQWKQLSPLLRVQAGVRPTIIFHGTADIATPFADAKAFYEAMRKAGNRCELVAHEGGKHGYFLGSPILFEETLSKTEAFLRTLGFVEAGIPAPIISPKSAHTDEASRQEATFSARARENEERQKAGMKRVLGTASIQAFYEPGKEVQDAVALRYRFHVAVNDGVQANFWKIVFLYTRFYSADKKNQCNLRCLHLSNRPVYEHSENPREGGKEGMKTCTAEAGLNFSVADDHRTGKLGSRTQDVTMFPKRLHEVDGISGYWSHAHFAQRNLNGQTVTVEITRGRTTSDQSGWTTPGKLPPAVYRIWTMTAEIDGKQYSVDFVLPDRQAPYLDRKNPVILATEAFYNHPGLFKVFFWDFAVQRENGKEWIPLHTWKLNKAVGVEPGRNTWGFRATSFRTSPAIEASNDDTPTYLKQGDIIDLPH